MRLLLELCCALVIKPVDIFTICAKLTMPFTFTRLPSNFYTSVSDVVVVLDLNKNIGGSTDLEKKRHGSTDLHTPSYSPLSLLHLFEYVLLFMFSKVSIVFLYIYNSSTRLNTW